MVRLSRVVSVQVVRVTPGVTVTGVPAVQRAARGLGAGSSAPEAGEVRARAAPRAAAAAIQGRWFRVTGSPPFR